MVPGRDDAALFACCRVFASVEGCRRFAFEHAGIARRSSRFVGAATVGTGTARQRVAVRVGVSSFLLQGGSTSRVRRDDWIMPIGSAHTARGFEPA